MVRYAIMTAELPKMRATELYRFSRISATVYCEILRTRWARKYTIAIPTQAPALIQSSEKPIRKANPAPPNRLPDPIHEQTRVPARKTADVFLPATMKSSCVLTDRPL